MSSQLAKNTGHLHCVNREGLVRPPVCPLVSISSIIVTDLWTWNFMCASWR